VDIWSSLFFSSFLFFLAVNSSTELKVDGPQSNQNYQAKLEEIIANLSKLNGIIKKKLSDIPEEFIDPITHVRKKAPTFWFHCFLMRRFFFSPGNHGGASCHCRWPHVREKVHQVVAENARYFTAHEFASQEQETHSEHCASATDCTVQRVSPTVLSSWGASEPQTSAHERRGRIPREIRKNRT
jgi:hypothetical protein